MDFAYPKTIHHPHEYIDPLAPLQDSQHTQMHVDLIA